VTERLASLRRIARVQAQMTRLCEWKLTRAEQTCRDLAEDKTRLQSYVVEQGSLGVPLAKAALRSLHALDTRLSEAQLVRDESRVGLDRSKRRQRTVAEIEGRVETVVRRADEDRDLATTLDAWLAARRADEY
jgi:hypothetical protein